MEKENQAIKDIITEIVSKMGFECTVEDLEENEKIDTKTFNIKTQESSFLIGQHGVNLQSLQHIARVLARKRIPEKSNFILDVNSYRQEKHDSLIRFARAMAEQSIREKRAIVLKPMSPYERRIVHIELSNNDQIKTESIGEGADRKIVISPLNLI